MFGFSKLFVIFIFIAALIGYGTRSWGNFFLVLGVFAVIRIVWKLLT
jgi:hypothetical protein